MTLDDPKVQDGLWKELEHMSKGERARIMVKDAYDYGHIETADSVEFSEYCIEGEKRR